MVLVKTKIPSGCKYLTTLSVTNRFIVAMYAEQLRKSKIAVDLSLCFERKITIKESNGVINNIRTHRVEFIR